MYNWITVTANTVVATEYGGGHWVRILAPVPVLLIIRKAPGRSKMAVFSPAGTPYTRIRLVMLSHKPTHSTYASAESWPMLSV